MSSSSIPSEIPSAYQSSFEASLASLSTTSPSYLSFAAIANAATAVLADPSASSTFISVYDANKAALLTLQTSASGLRDSVNQMAAFVASVSGPSGAPFSSAPPLPWLTTAQIQELQSASSQWPPSSLLAAFRSYADLGIQLFDQTSLVFQHLYVYATLCSTNAPQADIDAALATVQSDLLTLKTLTTQWATYHTDLEAALNDYTSTLALTDPLRVVFTQMQAYATNVIQPLIDNAIAQSQAAYTAAQTADQAAQQQFMDNPPVPGLPQDLEAIQLGIQEQQVQLQAALQGVKSSYQVQLTATGANASQPILVQSRVELSMRDLMQILGKTQLMIQDLARLFSSVDTSLADTRARLSMLNLQSSSSQTNAYLAAIRQASILYNQTVDTTNLQTYTTYQTNYQRFLDNIPLINTVIAAANQSIADQNNRALLIASASTIIDQDALDTIGALTSYDTLAEELTPPTSTLGTLTPPPSVGTAVIPLFSEVTTADFPTLPPFTTTDGFDETALDTFNQGLLTLLGNIGPLLPDIISALVANNVQIDTTFELPQLYLDQLVPVSDPVFSSGVYTTLNGSLSGFLLQMFLQKYGSEISTRLAALLLENFPDIFTIPHGVEAVTNPRTGVPVMIGLAVGDVLNQKGDAGRALNIILEDGSLQAVVSHSIERAAIIAGLNVAGTTPAWIKNLGRKGVSLSAAIEEFVAGGGKVTEQETTQSSYLAFAEQLVREATNEKALRQAAVTLISTTPKLAGLPTSAIRNLISAVAIVHKSFLLGVATAAAMQGGMDIQQVFSAILTGPALHEALATEEQVGGRDELETTLKALGLPQNARTISKAIIIVTQQAKAMREPSPSRDEKPRVEKQPSRTPERAESGAVILRSAERVRTSLVQNYRRLPPELQTKIAEQPSVQKLATKEIPAETVAAVVVPVRLGLITPQVGATLLGLSLSNRETAVIHRLVTPTPQERQIREDERLTERRREEVALPYKHPVAVPKSLHTQLREGYQRLYRNTTDDRQAKTAFENFARTVKRLSDFNTVALSTLMDPAKTIIKQFSFLTRTQQDSRQQPPISV